jgi:hypothetical protein
MKGGNSVVVLFHIIFRFYSCKSTGVQTVETMTTVKTGLTIVIVLWR